MPSINVAVLRFPDVMRNVCRSSCHGAPYAADRVSLTIDHDTPQVMEITGLSMAARAKVVVDPTEGAKALQLLMSKYPPQGSLPLPMPTPADIRIFRVTPIVVSVLDYSKGFGHLVTC